MCVILQVEAGHVKLDLLARRSRYSPLAVPEKVIESFPSTPWGFKKIITYYGDKGPEILVTGVFH